MAEGLRANMQGWPARGAALLRNQIAMSHDVLTTANDLAKQMRDQAIAESPTGPKPRGRRFRESWVTRVQPAYAGGAQVWLENVSDHAVFVLQDTKAHRIPTEGNTLLHWTGGKYGPGDHYAMHVQHPGTTANRVGERTNDKMQPAYREASDRLGYQVTSRVVQAFAER